METRNNRIGLPIAALGLDLAPVLIIFLGSIIRGFPSFTFLFMVLFPVAGLITGIVYLSFGKGKIDRIGKILAIIAISLPLAVVLLFLVIFVGAATGLISLM
jgi:ABC-type dipeptide/oligopeptide/nickel transport system permease component